MPSPGAPARHRNQPNHNERVAERRGNDRVYKLSWEECYLLQTFIKTLPPASGPAGHWAGCWTLRTGNRDRNTQESRQALLIRLWAIQKIIWHSSSDVENTALPFRSEEMQSKPCKHALPNTKFKKPQNVFNNPSQNIEMGEEFQVSPGRRGTPKCKVNLKQEPKVHRMSFHGCKWGEGEVLISFSSHMCKGKGHSSHRHRREITKVNNVVQKSTSQDKGSG